MTPRCVSMVGFRLKDTVHRASGGGRGVGSLSSTTTRNISFWGEGLRQIPPPPPPSHPCPGLFRICVKSRWFQRAKGSAGRGCTGATRFCGATTVWNGGVLCEG